MQNKVLIVGSGNLGISTGLSLIKRNILVTFFDIDDEKNKILKNKKYNLFVENESYNYDFIFICVPTPTFKFETFLNPLDEAINFVAEIISKSKESLIVVVRSTVLPGIMENRVKPRLKFLVGKKDYGIVYQPAFMRERQGILDEINPWVTVFAADNKKTARKLKGLLPTTRESFEVSFNEAELIKFGSNLFNVLKISYFNQLFLLSNKIGANGKLVSKVVSVSAEGSWNKNYGIKPGYPFGGSCLPKDLEAFIGFLKKNKIKDYGLFDGVLSINKEMAKYSKN